VPKLWLLNTANSPNVYSFYQHRYLKPSLHGVAPHLFVVLCLAVDGIDDHEGEVAVVYLLLERLDEGGTVAGLHFLFVLVLKKLK